MIFVFHGKLNLVFQMREGFAFRTSFLQAPGDLKSGSFCKLSGMGICLPGKFCGLLYFQKLGILSGVVLFFATLGIGLAEVYGIIQGILSCVSLATGPYLLSCILVVSSQFPVSKLKEEKVS
mgnify:CR=1 FL=1